MTKAIKAGTRGSKLALAQTDMVLSALQGNNPEGSFEAVRIKTTGDMRQGTPEASTLDKKAWIRELEEAILSEKIDFAVHSGKDVPNDIEAGTALLPILERANPADCFIGKLTEAGSRISFSEVPEGGVIGTASLRRKASLLRLRPDLNIVEHRGNVPTRLRKLDESKELSGIILASAGVDRSKDVSVEYNAFDTNEFLPALAQGTLVAQYKESRSDVHDLLLALSTEELRAIYTAERACAEKLEVDCHSVLGVFADIHGEELQLIARVLAPDGSSFFDTEESGVPKDAQIIGDRAAQKLLDLGAGKYL